MRYLQTALLTLLMLVCSAAQAEITGAVTSGAGELAIINSDREAAWSVSPADYLASYAVSDDGKTVYFASPKKGIVTFYAASVVDGLPNIDTHTLYNGVDKPDDVSPAPAPQPKPDTIASVIKGADVIATAGDYNALANAFGAAVSGIDRGTITTPAGARETFRAVWLQEAAKTNPAAITGFAGLLDKLSGMIDYIDLTTTAKSYKEAADALRAKADAQTKAQAAIRRAQPTQRQTCPGGQCYRWGW